jgi:DNA-binding NtrC family response regulator
MLRKGNLLLVDDDLCYLQCCATVLEEHGFSVVTASDPIVAMSVALQGRTELTVALIDYHMPIMNGPLLATCLKAICPDLKVVLHSGDATLPVSEMESIDAFVEKGSGISAVIEHLLDTEPSTSTSKFNNSRNSSAWDDSARELS